MTGKYAPLEKYLSDLPKSKREITLAFEQIEKILADKLPSSACSRTLRQSGEISLKPI
jgi:hypothetical protein